MPPLASICETQLTEEPAALSIRRIIRVPVLHADHDLPARCGSGNAQHAFDWSTSPLPSPSLPSGSFRVPLSLIPSTVPTHKSECCAGVGALALHFAPNLARSALGDRCDFLDQPVSRSHPRSS